MPQVIGAPAQYSQPSRKGKKAWRKNVNIESIEEGLEEIRDQERILGCVLLSSPACFDLLIGLALLFHLIVKRCIKRQMMNYSRLISLETILVGAVGVSSYNKFHLHTFSQTNITKI
jgi:hypothetical protein